jgi:hypothetical protein
MNGIVYMLANPETTTADSTKQIIRPEFYIFINIAMPKK